MTRTAIIIPLVMALSLVRLQPSPLSLKKERMIFMQFANAMREEGQTTFTENGAVALNTTGDARLDLFGTIGSLRKADENRIITLFAEAYKQDALFATKIAFYARDIREGLGERNTFRVNIIQML